MKKLYYKLVRDKIPDILEEARVRFSVHQASGEDLRSYALEKLQEEVQEFITNPCGAEAADILEILYFICELEEIGPKMVMAEKTAKRVSNGSFDRGLILEWTDDE